MPRAKFQALKRLDYAHEAKLAVPLSDGLSARSRASRPQSHNLFLYGCGDTMLCKVDDFGLEKTFDASSVSRCTTTGITIDEPCFMPRQQDVDFNSAAPKSMCGQWQRRCTSC
jgi:hypothetical protein